MKFAADRTVGKLAQWLRLMGYDALDTGPFSPESVLSFTGEDRILLTRDTHLIRKTATLKAICLHSNDPKDQVRELVHTLLLQPDEKVFFTRCKFCNTILERVTSQEVIDEVPDYVRQRHKRFSKCNTCERVYWPGTHYDNITKTLQDLLAK
ncbi:MAG: Mut7-C RNAse domain-containing protein [Desulfobacteria bacterium]